MKKQVKPVKLQLNTQTVRTLTDVSLSKVVGGAGVQTQQPDTAVCKINPKPF